MELDEQYEEYKRQSSENKAQRDSKSTSADTDTTWRVSVYGTDRIGKGPMLFSGPDGLRNHIMYVEPEHRYVGEGTMSPEGTSEVDYLWRAPPTWQPPRPKSALVGEIGWSIPQMTDWSAPSSGHQHKLRDFRQDCEQRCTHVYQNPWNSNTTEPVNVCPRFSREYNGYHDHPDYIDVRY